MERSIRPGLRVAIAMISTLCGLGAGPWQASPLTAQQTGTITGSVTDAATQRPIAGAQVRVLGAELGAVSDAAGGYRIGGVPAGARQVQATRLGYTANTLAVTVGAGGTATANFALATEAVELEGIVAVGYGTQRRQDVTGSVTSVSAARLEEVPNTTVAQALQGAAAGVSITNTAAGAEPRFNILIRGQNSITASNDPLVVVDGIPYNGNLAEINQNDVSSIDVLKDASATAIYGARGANGVILISTKKGRTGRAQVTYDGYTGMQEVANLPRLMNGEEFAAFKCKRVSELRNCDDTLTRTEKESLASGHSVDWIDLATRRGTQQQHTLSVSGGSSDTRFYLSGSALNTEGVAVNDKFVRYTARLNLDQKVGSAVDLGVSTQLSQSDRSGEEASFGSAFLANPLIHPYEADGRTIALTPWPEDPERVNPLQSLNIIDDDISRRALASSYVEARLPFLEGLSFRVNGGIDFLSRDNGRYLGRNTRSGLNSQGQASTESERGFDWTIENILRFRRDFGAHTLDLTTLYGAQASEFETNTLASEGFPNDVLTYRQGHVARSVLPSYGFRESGLISQMGRLNYGYDGRYLVTLTARRDGFSGFGGNYKYGTFPSLALGWNVSSEPFWNLAAVNELKLRASYGKNGNHAIQPYQTLARLAERSYLDGSSTWPGFVPATLGNPNLRWEATTSLNGGVDFGLFESRLRGTVDVYSSDTHDLLLNRLISPVHGIPRMVENIGSLRNSGVELMLSGVPLENDRFSWTADFNLSSNRNEILDLYGDATDDLVNEWFIGQSIDTNFGFVFDGVWQQGDDIRNSAQPTARAGDPRVRDVNGDGKINVEDRAFIGHEDPSYTAGLSNTLRYGNLTLNVFVHTVQGSTRYNDLLLDTPRNLDDTAARANSLLFEYWTPENPINTRWANRQGNNPFFVGLYEDAGFIRLKDLTLSYDVPSSLRDRLGAGNLRVYANGRNLWTHTEWTGLDPELSNQRATPLERVFSVGLNASF